MGAICKEKLPKVRVPTKEELFLQLLKSLYQKPIGSLFKIDLMGSKLSD
jgi:hypothetical protein